MSEAAALPPDQHIWWRNRRRMAWTALTALLAIGATALVRGVPAGADELLGSIAWVLGLIVLGYVGAATLSDIASMRR